MRAKSEITRGIRIVTETVVFTAALNAGYWIEKASLPPQPVVIERIASAPTEPVEFEDFNFYDFITEAEGLKANPNLFLGRKLKITLEQNVFAIRAAEQEELKDENGEELINYIIQGKGKDGSVKFLIVNVPQNQVGEGFLWPPSGNPPRPRMFPKKTVLELTGKQLTVGYQASIDKNARMAVAVLIATKPPQPPGPEFAVANQ